MNDDPKVLRIRQILEAQGGLYEWEDFVSQLEAGALQSFHEDSSAVFTAVRQYPRKKVLEVVVAVGTLEGIYRIQPRVVAFAKDQGCDLMMASVGRDGWFDVKTPGWNRVASTYIRRL